MKNLLLALAVLALVGVTMSVSKTCMGGVGYVMLGGELGACLLLALRPRSQPEPEFTIAAILALVIISAFLLSRDSDSSIMGFRGIVIMTIASLSAGAVSSYLFLSIHEEKISSASPPDEPDGISR